MGGDKLHVFFTVLFQKSEAFLLIISRITLINAQMFGNLKLNV